MKEEIKGSTGWIVKMLLVLCFFEAVFRTSPDSSLSAYRLTIPFIFLLIVLPKVKLYGKELFFLIGLLFWNVLWVAVFHHDFATMFQFYFHVLCIFSVYALVKFIKITWPDHFDDIMFALLDTMTILTILVFIPQYVLRFNLPNTVSGRVNTFYWTENEMGMSLVVMATLYVQRFLKGKRWMDLIKILMICVILYLNDNRISILGFALFIMLILFIEYSSPKAKKYSLGVLGILIILFFLWDPVIDFKGSQLGVAELIGDPIRRIIMLDPYRLAGSLYDRTDAIIYGLIELQRTFFMGIGLGNSLNVLAMPKYYLVSAKSMHNIVAQLWVELGLFAMVMYAAIAFKIIKDLRAKPFDLTVNYRFCFVLAFILISMQSSSGIFSNYFVAAFVSYICLSKDLFASVPKRPWLPFPKAKAN